MLSLISCNTCHTFLPYINSVSRAIVDHCNIIAVTVKFLFLRCWKLLYNDFSRSLLVLVKTVVSFWQCDWNDSIAVEKICCQNKMLIILIISVGHNVCKEIWNPTLGEELNVRIEPNYYVDKSAVTVQKIENFFWHLKKVAFAKTILFPSKWHLLELYCEKYLAKYTMLRM